MHNYQALYYIFGAVSLGCTALWYAGKWAIIKPVQYFTRLEGLLRSMSGDVNEIKTNHLPHIYDRITRIEAQFEIRQNPFGHE